MMKGKMLEISSPELKKKNLLCWVHTCISNYFCKKKSHESDFKNKKSGTGKRDVNK